VRELTSDDDAEWAARLRYAYADALLAAGRREEAREWFSRAAAADPENLTDATERMLELDGVVLDDDVVADTVSFRLLEGAIGELVHAHQVLDLGLAAGLLADVADDGVDGALICADLATGETPEPVTVALLAEEDAAGFVGDHRTDGRCEGVHRRKA